MPALIVCIFLFLPSSLLLGQPKTYDASIGSIEQKPSSKQSGSTTILGNQKKRIYSFYELMNLRSAFAPHSITLLDYRSSYSGRPIIRKVILFSYSDPKASHVSIAGDFNHWSPVKMERNPYGTYFFTLDLRAQEKIQRGKRSYAYKFVRDSVWISDPHNQDKKGDSMGAYVSIFYTKATEINKQISLSILEEAKGSREKLVEFSIYLPQKKYVALVGSFNDWNPDYDPMIASGKGIFRKRLRLEPGEYTYKYIADGQWLLDTYNAQTRFDPVTRELYSFFIVP